MTTVFVSFFFFTVVLIPIIRVINFRTYVLAVYCTCTYGAPNAFLLDKIYMYIFMYSHEYLLSNVYIYIIYM
jgi:hypothetical protein